MANQRIVHFEIPAENPEGLTKFYGEMFDWKFQKADNFDYWMADTGEGDGISGAVMQKQAPQQTVTNYVNVTSVDQWSDKAKSLGGNVVVPKQAVTGRGWFAQVTDPQGNVVGLWQNDENAA